MSNFGIFKGFSDKLFEGELPINLGKIGSESFGFTGLLDTYPNAAAAYSLRLLRSVYTGSAIRVRRSSDNTEQDIGFTALGALDTTSLTTFCGSGNGFVTTWYDQSGNARNATQTTAANQPQIVSGGNVINVNSKPSLQFDGSTDRFEISSNFSNFSNTSIFSNLSPSSYGSGSENARFYDLYDGTYHIQYLRDQTSQRLHVKNTLWQSDTNATQFITQNAPTSQFLSTVLALSSSNDLYYNTSSQSKTSTSNVGSAGTISVIGSRADAVSTTHFNGNYQELIIYPSDQSSNRTGIESNINTYYGIY